MRNLGKKLRFCIPTLITVLSFCFAFLAIVLVLQNDFYCSFGFALLAFITDTLDGFLARKLGSETRTGAILDSIGDVFIYLVYPSIVFIYFFRLDSILAFIFIGLFFSAGLYRLVRFTNKGFSSEEGGIGYSGAPVVFSHAIVLCFVLLKVLNVSFFVPLFYVVIFLFSVLMIQNFYFPKPKRILILAVLLAGLSAIFFSLCLV